MFNHSSTGWYTSAYSTEYKDRTQPACWSFNHEQTNEGVLWRVLDRICYSCDCYETYGEMYIRWDCAHPWREWMSPFFVRKCIVLNQEKFDEKHNKYYRVGVSKKNALPEAGKCIMKKTNRRFSQFISNFLNTQNIQQFAYVNTAEKHSLELVIWGDTWEQSMRRQRAIRATAVKCSKVKDLCTVTTWEFIYPISTLKQWVLFLKLK